MKQRPSRNDSIADLARVPGVKPKHYTVVEVAVQLKSRVADSATLEGQITRLVRQGNFSGNNFG
jgi:hypothetical protein